MLELWELRYFQINIDNMQERVRLINGKLIMHSQPGKGTEIFIEVPSQS